MITRHNNTPSDSVSHNTAQRSPASTPALSPELRDALRQWDDTDADTLEASKERLTALGPQVSDELAAFVRRRAHTCHSCARVVFVDIALFYIVMFGWTPRQDAHAPMPVSIALTLAALIITFIGSAGLSSWAASQSEIRNAAKGLAETNPIAAVSIFAEMKVHFPEGKDPIRTPLLTALQRLLACDTLPPADFSDKQRRGLRHFIGGGIHHIELTVTALQLLTRMEDASAVPQVRRLAKRSQVWEVQEAANEYLTRFAPEEVAWLEATGAASTSQAGEDSILTCVMRLGSRSEGERQAAQTALHHMDAAQLGQVLHMLGREPVEGRQLGNILYAICIAVGAVIGSLTYLPCIHSPYYDTRMALTVSIVCAMGGGAFGWLAGANVNYARRNRDRARMLGCDNGVFPEKRLLESLEALDNPALLGTLISQMPQQNSIFTTGMYVRKALQTALTRILPRLQASDAALLDEPTRGLLNQQLAKGRRSLSEIWGVKREIEEQAAYDVAILKAWEQVGDERALPFVEKLAGLSAGSPAQKRVQQAAQECLPYLQTRADRQRVAQTLLRAAQPPVEPGDILLRAATAHAAPVETEQLLRASRVER